MNNFIFYDTETSGVKELDFIQVIQFAAIQTDENFRSINSFNELCSPLPWTLVSPKALAVNKKSEIFQTDKTHYELVKEIHNTWKYWTEQHPAVFVSYNGMRFDEEVMRRQFYWNLFDPYFTNTNGNSRLDLYLKMQVIAHFYYQSFPIPQIDDQMSLKLEDIISNLLIDTKNAHDALADCEFLIHLIKCISEKLPNFYQEILDTTSKEGYLKKLQDDSIHFNCYFIPRSKSTRAYPFTPLINLYGLNKYIPIFDLSNDPEDYFDLSYTELEQLINKKKNCPFKRLALNKTQPTISLSTLKEDRVFIEDQEQLMKRADKIQTNEAFKEKIIDIYNNFEYQNSRKIHPEEQIYTEGFPSAIEKDRFTQFHNAQSYKEKIAIINSFEDSRYREFAYRICAQIHTEEVDNNILLSLKELKRSRFNDDGPWPNSLQNLEEGKNLLLETNKEDEKELLNLAINSIKKSL
jgi:exodeoxyribonuclease-1